ncbi:type II toxin-antitoxin system PemK/MazF family toxin [Roseofilum sp. BLCC_M143]|uniref:Type II toxin-antitoxin system PemK/MazF family toxin n=1 Tax=Roseofilum casamattae BLCC-M143 TaxID=3022442 RepID=A0ABT7BVA0_9CYAN|nr:type II toxin-antitoxin system PemK/MazF family toxin [Roseofilum casamattae]MDJ1182434.1 type II toxin-antitoxin system PemK/MazF family toxin [Roseofilum casamattae BLCC-M143]
MTMIPKPKRGEIWQVNLDPTLGDEIRKTRPAIVVSANAIGKLPLKLVVPVTDWKTAFTANFMMMLTKLLDFSLGQCNR